MALNDAQIPSKSTLYSVIQSVATDLNRMVNRLSDLSEFLQRMDTADLDAIGVPSTDIRSQLVAFRVMLDELVRFLNGDSVTPTNDPSTVIDMFRRI